MQCLPKFPFYRTVKGSRLKYDILEYRWIPKIHEMFEQSAQSGGSVGIDEASTDSFLRDPVSEGRHAVQVTDDASGKFLGVTVIYPCWMNRSTRPVSSAAYILLEPHIKGLGIGREMLKLMGLMTWDRGYLSHTGRTSASAVSMNMVLKYGHVPTGVIPHSRLTPDGTRDMDGITHENYGHFDPEEYARRIQQITSERNILPVAPMSDSLPDWVLHDLETPIGPVVMDSRGAPVIIQPATCRDILPLEGLIRSAASTGRGYCLDEFQDGFFNRRQLRKSHVLCAKTRDGHVIGGTIFGRTAFCRSQTAPILSVYLVVDQNYQRQGIGRTLLATVEQFAKKQGMMGLFVDIFMTDLGSIQFLSKNGYVCLASFPHSGYVYKHGLTDAMLWHKRC